MNTRVQAYGRCHDLRMRYNTVHNDARGPSAPTGSSTAQEGARREPCRNSRAGACPRVVQGAFGSWARFMCVIFRDGPAVACNCAMLSCAIGAAVSLVVLPVIRTQSHAPMRGTAVSSCHARPHSSIVTTGLLLIRGKARACIVVSWHNETTQK